MPPQDRALAAGENREGEMGFEIASDLYLAALCAVALGTWIARDLPGSIRERSAGNRRAGF